jgi:hypothetical protein
MAAYPAWQATIVTEAGDIQPGAQVDVVLESTGLVPAGGIWSNRAGSSALTNPFFADANGFAQFYAAPGEYRITATGVGGTRVWRYVVLDGTAATKDTGTAAGQVPLNSDLTAQFADKSGKAWPTFSGNVTLSDGNLTIGTSGKGISFAAASGSAAGSTSAVLDDYEEGTWTPSLKFGGASVGMTYGSRVGSYTKIGNLVTASCFIALTSKGSSTGAAAIQGFPFVSRNVAGDYVSAVIRINEISFADFVEAYLPNNSATLAIDEVANSGTRSDITDANFSTVSNAVISISYRV